MKTWRYYFRSLAGVVFWFALGPHTLAAALQAGVARVDLTPSLSMKAALGGYGERMSRPATGVHDRVWAKALVLGQGGQRRAIVTADLLAFPPGFRETVATALAPDGWQADLKLNRNRHRPSPGRWNI